MPPGDSAKRSCRVKLQGRTVIDELDGEKAAGPRGLSFVRQFKVQASSEINVEIAELTRGVGTPILCGVEVKLIDEGGEKEAERKGD
jgi:hypothetical protein